MPKLSKRLKIIASLVPLGARVCDIGTDHAYLSIELSKRKDIKKIIAADLNSKPLYKAQENILKANANGIELRLSNGFEAIKLYETDTAVIAGIGGEVMSNILEQGFNIIKNSDYRLILQPTTSPEMLRKFLFENGFSIDNELPVLENGKLYSVISSHFVGGNIKYLPFECFIGKVDFKSVEGYDYIKKQYDRCMACVEALALLEEKRNEYSYYKSITDKLGEILNLKG